MSTAENLKQFSNALSYCAEDIEALTDHHNVSHFVEKSNKHWEYLQSHGFIYHAGESHYKGTPLLFELVATIGMRTSMRRVAPDINDWYNTLETDIELMIAARDNHDENSRRQHQQRIDYHVILMVNSLEKEVLDIEYSINSKLGKIESLKAKEKENTRLIRRAISFVDKLASLKIDRLQRFADMDYNLRNILMITMSPRIRDYSQRFKTALPTLKRMLWQTKRKTKETQKVWALYRHFSSGGQCLTDDLTEEEIQSSIFNITSELEINANTGTDQLESTELIKIAEHLKKPIDRSDKENVVLEEKADYVDSKDDVIDLAQPVLYPVFIAFIKTLGQEPVSAMTFWRTQESKYSSRSWLMWLSLEVKKHKALSSNTHYVKTEALCGNKTVYDIEVAINGR